MAQAALTRGPLRSSRSAPLQARVAEFRLNSYASAFWAAGHQAGRRRAVSLVSLVNFRSYAARNPAAFSTKVKMGAGQRHPLHHHGRTAATGRGTRRTF